MAVACRRTLKGFRVAFLIIFILTIQHTSHRLLQLQARRVGDDPGSPYRAVELPSTGLTTTPFPDCQTLDDLIIQAVRVYGSKKCLGTREMLREEEEKQSNGRVFKKVNQLSGTWLSVSLHLNKGVKIALLQFVHQFISDSTTNYYHNPQCVFIFHALSSVHASQCKCYLMPNYVILCIPIYLLLSARLFWVSIHG